MRLCAACACRERPVEAREGTGFPGTGAERESRVAQRGRRK